MRRATLLLATLAWAGPLLAEPPQPPDPKQAVFVFTDEPAVSLTRIHDDTRYVITFASKGRCDAAVAIENADGRIVRHLAAGMLGPAAPAPFQADSLRQRLVWDGKDDAGRYVKDVAACTVRVSLGLQARLERTLFWSPHKRPGDPKAIGVQPSLIAAAPEGVYVYEGGGADHVRLFDHDGNYVRTVYPFPAGELAGVGGLNWHTFGDGAKVPLKWGLAQSTLLTSGNLAFGRNWPTAGGPAEAATALLHRAGQLFLVNQRINRLAAGDGRAALAAGPETGIPLSVKDAVPGREFMRDFHVSPRSAALSPDGKWLYLTGYIFNAYFRVHSLHGVARVAVDGDAAPELFAGVLKADAAGYGTDETHFHLPTSVACDKEGRVYVADWGNDRIQVFSPQGKLLKSIATPRPAEIRIHPQTGELYVFSWTVPGSLHPREKTLINAKLTCLGPLSDPRPRASFPLDLPNESNTRLAEAEVDFHTTPATIWLGRNRPISYRDAPFSGMGILLLAEKDGKLVVKKDFSADALDQVTRLRGPRHLRQRLYVNPANGWVYVGEHHDPAQIHVKSITELVAIDPATGKIRLVTLPFDTEDLAFDRDGLAYLRTMDSIARYDSNGWREVPFDYGEERRGLGYHPIRPANVLSAITAAGTMDASSQRGGMAVSPGGNIAVTFWNPAAAPQRTDEAVVGPEAVRKYSPRLYPGRQRDAEIHVWDKHGKLLYEDAFPGIGSMSGLGMDRDDNLYVMSAACRVLDNRPWFNDTTCTLIKIRPGQARVLSPRAVIPLPEAQRPQRSPDLVKGDLGRAWVVDDLWMRGGVGMDAKMLSSASRDCHCQATSRFALDDFARSFVPEVDRCSVLALDANGNPILRIGRYGNVDDGEPLVKAGGPPNVRALGGDEVGLFWANHVATDTDRRLFISDPGNARILSIRLSYHAEARVPLKAAMPAQP